MQRRQLDAKLTRITIVPAPPIGWIRTIREVLCMSSRQLGKRLGMSSQGALDLERRERDASITIAKLAEAAAALGCDVHVVLVPKSSLDGTVRNQAAAKSRGSKVITPAQAAELWMGMRLAQLWD